MTNWVRFSVTGIPCRNKCSAHSVAFQDTLSPIALRFGRSQAPGNSGRSKPVLSRKNLSIAHVGIVPRRVVSFDDKEANKLLVTPIRLPHKTSLQIVYHTSCLRVYCTRVHGVYMPEQGGREEHTAAAGPRGSASCWQSACHSPLRFRSYTTDFHQQVRVVVMLGRCKLSVYMYTFASTRVRPRNAYWQ